MIASSCSSATDGYDTPEVERLGTASGPCIRLRFSAGRQTTFYSVVLLGPLSLCSLLLLALLVPRPRQRSRDGGVVGGRLDWRAVRIPALLMLTAVFILQLHFVANSLLRARLSLIGTCALFLRLFMCSFFTKTEKWLAVFAPPP